MRCWTSVTHPTATCFVTLSSICIVIDLSRIAPGQIKLQPVPVESRGCDVASVNSHRGRDVLDRNATAATRGAVRVGSMQNENIVYRKFPGSKLHIDGTGPIN